MLENTKLIIDEAQRLSQHNEVKGKVRSVLHEEILDNINKLDFDEQDRIGNLATELKNRALNEVVETDTEIERGRLIARTSQIVDYVFYLFYGIIGLEVLLELLGARESNSFKRLLDAVSMPILMMFSGLMPDPALGQFRLMFSYIMALVIYALIHLAINGLLRLFAHKKSEI